MGYIQDHLTQLSHLSEPFCVHEFRHIPSFICYEIFSYLHFDEKRQLRKVSKLWNALITPKIVGTLDFYGKTYDRPLMESFLSKYGSYAKRVSLDWELCPQNSLNNNILLLLNSTCQNIRALKITIKKSWQVPSKFILGLGETQKNLSYLGLFGYICKDLLISISPVLKKIVALEVGELWNEKFLLGPLIPYFTCPKLKIFTLTWTLENEAYILDDFRKNFGALELINYDLWQGRCHSVEHIRIRLKPDAIKFFRLKDRMGGTDADLEFINGVSPIVGYNGADTSGEHFVTNQINALEDFLVYSSKFPSTLETRLPGLKKLELSSCNFTSKKFFDLLCALKSVPIVILELQYKLDKQISLPEIDFQTKFLSIKAKNEDFPVEYLDWISLRFRQLEELYIHTDIHSKWHQADLKFQSLLKLHVTVSVIKNVFF